jgi:putative aldouronate transport system substrate-binding protein
MEQNPAWQEVNKQLGGALKLTIASSADYPTKLNTVIAGDDLPELIYINPATHNLANQLAFLQAKMADLTPYLSGDAVRDFPNLANFPAFAWQGPGSVYNQHIWGVPDPRPIFPTRSWSTRSFWSKLELNCQGVRTISSASSWR